jgi:hypothetical protein
MSRVTVAIEQAQLNAVTNKLQSIPLRVGRKALSKGVFKAGAESLKQARNRAPRGKTGQFKRSMAQKNIRYAARSTYQSIVGHRYGKRSTAKRFQPKAGGGMISKGLSGQGAAPAIWWMDRGVKPHTIRPRRRRWLAWNILRGSRKPVKPNRYSRYGVRHPGHVGNQFMTRLIIQGKASRIATVRKELVAEARKLGYGI